jgi:cobalt-zinc-cadmium efflux system protein
MADHQHAEHEPGHDHAPKNFGLTFAIVVALNMALVVLQAAYGFVANSVALLADAGHNFGDVLGLLLAWGGHVMASAPPTRRHTYGFRSASILAAIGNGIILLVATGAIAWEAIERFSEPGEVAGATVMIVAAIGIAINGVSAWLLMAGQKDDLNIRGAFLHLVGDAAVSMGVVLAGGMILLTGWHWLDPAASLAISAVVVWSTWGLLRNALNLSLGAVPGRLFRVRDLPLPALWAGLDGAGLMRGNVRMRMCNEKLRSARLNGRYLPSIEFRTALPHGATYALPVLRPFCTQLRTRALSATVSQIP